MAADDQGLNLVRAVDRIDAAHVTTEYRAGLATGQVTRLLPSGSGIAHIVCEPQDETAMPDEGGRMLRYSLADLEDGVYMADSVGPSATSRVTYFEVTGGSVRRVFDGERRALQELRRRER